MTPSALRAKLNSYLPHPAWPLLGFPLLEAWQPALFTSPLIGSGTPLIHVHLFALLAMAICPLVIALTVHRVIPVMAYRHSQTTTFGLLATLSTVCIWLASEPGGILPQWCLPVGYVCAAACLTWLLLCWQTRLAPLGVRGAILGLAISTLLGTALFIVLMLLPSGLSHGLSALLPMCSSLFLLRMQASGGIVLPPERPIDESHDSKAQTSRNGTAKLEARKSEVGSAVFSPQAPSRRGAWLRGIPLKLMFVVVLASFVGGAIRVFGPMQQLDLSGSTAWLGFCASDVCSMILSCVVAFYAHRHSIQTAFYIALPTMFIGCIAIATLPTSLVQLGETVVSTGVTMIQTLVWALALSESLVRQRPALGIFAITMASKNLGYLLGQGMGSTVRLDTQTCLYASLFVILVIALVMVSMNGKLVVSHDALERPPVDPFEQRVKTLSDQARLSARETEVLALWASGHGGAYLEKALGISKNTIKTHLSHIYGKTKTSNREELIALLESIEVAGEARLADSS